jgi:hypothetical protein
MTIRLDHTIVPGFYFEDPYGHLLEVMTVPETGSAG